MRLGNDEKKYSYSSFERKVFSALKLNKGKSTIDIAEEIYNGGDRPFNARQSVLGALKNLSKKVKANREPFVVKQSERKGPHPINFWIEK